MWYDSVSGGGEGTYSSVVSSKCPDALFPANGYLVGSWWTMSGVECREEWSGMSGGVVAGIKKIEENLGEQGAL